MSQSIYVRSETNQYGEWVTHKMFTGSYFTKYSPSSTTHLKLGIVSKRFFNASLLEVTKEVKRHISRIKIALESFDNDTCLGEYSE